jgi:hypothetical protein
MGGAGRVSYSIAVRALCEFTAKVGDLDLRFTPSPTALEGIVGHRTVASRRSEGYQNEVALEGQYRTLTVKGRADGYDPVQNCLEEVKTYRGDLSKQPANHRQLHWAQAKIYGALMCQKLQLERINLALVYFDIVSEKETCLVEACTGPNRKWPIAKDAIWRRNSWHFPMPTFVPGNGIWPSRCSRRSAPVSA